MTLRVVLWVYSEGSESYDRQLFSESKMYSQVGFGFILKKTNKRGFDASCHYNSCIIMYFEAKKISIAGHNLRRLAKLLDIIGKNIVIISLWGYLQVILQ